jgi:hypothetical protein
MSKPLYKQPWPALGLAVGATAVAHWATANAARAVGVPPMALSLLIGLILIGVSAMAQQR